MKTAFIDEVLRDALEKEGGGIQPKVRIALKYLVEHLAEAEREIERQQQRIDALERIAHPPFTNAVGMSR